MKKRSLIITTQSFDVEEINNSLESNNHLWLQLWPILDSENKSKFEVVNPTSYISNSDHKIVSDFITNLSKNWWKTFGFNKISKEFNIDGLTISQIFSYELELELTKLLFNILTINKAIRANKFEKLIFFHSQNSNLHNLYEFYKNTYNCEIRLISVKSPKKKYHDYLRRVSMFFLKTDLYNRLKIKFFTKKTAKNSIIISNSYRCLKNFILDKSVLNQFYILNDILFIDKDENKKTLFNSLDKDNKSLLFDNISIYPFISIKLQYIENKFHSLNEFYFKLIKLAKICKPKIYITVNMASSIEIVKIWAFKNAGIRSVHSSEGLGVPNKYIGKELFSVLHPEIDIERWGFSKQYLNYFDNSSVKIVTGFFDIKKKINYELPKKIITYFLSSPNISTQRAFNDDDIFELIDSVKDIANAISYFDDYQLIIKIHPGDKYLKPILKSIIDPRINFKIIGNANNFNLIKRSKLIIGYNTSMILESLFHNKNVIYYNYTGRSNYTDSFAKELNSDTEKGTVLIEAKSKSELIEKIRFLISSPENKIKCHGIEEFLQNADQNYDRQVMINNLLNE